MITWGINALNHGSSLALFENNQLISNELSYSDTLTYDIVTNGLKKGYPDQIFWYERPWLKKTRQLRAGQWSRAIDSSVLPRKFVDKLGFKNVSLFYTPHHASHAAAGYYTSPFNKCVVVVLDAIGEFECASIWEGREGNLTKVWKRNYPNSLGLFYSAFTDLIGYKPILEEHRLQEDSQKGNCSRYYDIVKSYFSGTVILTSNFHKGVKNWPYPINSDQDRYDIAAAVQQVYDEQISSVIDLARSIVKTDSLVYMGGCAMNSLTNKRIVEPRFRYIWSLPQPGDPSSSIGSVLYHTKQRIEKFNFGTVKHIKINI